MLLLCLGSSIARSRRQLCSESCQWAIFRQEQRVLLFEETPRQFARVTRVRQLILAVVPNVRRAT
jgi:hypothetical protein